MRRYILPQKLNAKETQDLLCKLLLSDKPAMIGRFGSVEIQGTLNAVTPFPFSLLYQKRTYRYLINNAGFFPVNRKSVKKFAKIMIEAMKNCDCLASWRIEEFFFKKELRKAKKISLDALGPVGSNIEDKSIWLSALANKKILVISPFAELIEKQYRENRERIWKNPNILPKYANLKTIKAINSIGGNCDFDSWFDALEYLKNEIKKVDFDIAILGCGAYGFPLASFIKDLGKKAVHVGGATQIIFGIKGKRWEKAQYINEYWVSPRKEDRPKGFENVEGGCYW